LAKPRSDAGGYLLGIFFERLIICRSRDRLNCEKGLHDRLVRFGTTARMTEFITVPQYRMPNDLIVT
jgi:hypothetical protein